MSGHSDRGRTLWLAVVILLAAFVLADFVRSPLLPGSGAGAISAPKLTLWVPGPEASGPGGQVAAAAAAGLELAGRPTVVKHLKGGTSAALAALLSAPPRRSDDLLVISSSSLVGLARDETDAIVPGAAGSALEARALLRRAQAVGLLSRERLALASLPGSGIGDSADLVERIRRAPGSAVFAIPDDSWSRAELARLVNRSGRGGTVPFVAYEDDDLVARARADGVSKVLLGSRGALAAEARAGRLVPLAWPVGRAPRSWVALVAPATYPRRRLAVLRAWIARLVDDPRWRRHERTDDRAPGRPWSPALEAMLRAEERRSRHDAETVPAIGRLQR